MYCLDILNRKRLPTLEVTIGALNLGGKAPIRLQSMTTTDTMNTELSVEQSIRMITAGCELLRLTAPSKKEAEIEEFKEQYSTTLRQVSPKILKEKILEAEALLKRVAEVRELLMIGHITKMEGVVMKVLTKDMLNESADKDRVRGIVRAEINNLKAKCVDLDYEFDLAQLCPQSLVDQIT